MGDRRGYRVNKYNEKDHDEGEDPLCSAALCLDADLHSEIADGDGGRTPRSRSPSETYGRATPWRLLSTSFLLF